MGKTNTKLEVLYVQTLIKIKVRKMSIKDLSAVFLGQNKVSIWIDYHSLNKVHTVFPETVLF